MDVLSDIVVCSICLSGIYVEFSEERLQCTHRFHKKCLKTWLEKNQSCPECRENVTYTSFMKEKEIADSITIHIAHAFQCLSRYSCDDAKLKITNWVLNLQESVNQQDDIEKTYSQSSDYAIADRFLRLSNYSIGPPYSVEEIRLGYAMLQLEWHPEIEIPKYFHKPIIPRGSFDENIRKPGTKLIFPPDFIESPAMKLFEHRISTFRNFPCNFVNVNTLAAIGFFFDSTLGDDYCKCAYCGVVIGNFHGSSPPKQLHSLFSPLCTASDLLEAFFDHY